MQWTRSRDGLGGVLRKLMTQRRDAATQRLGHNGIADPALQHMLLVEASAEGTWADWFESHPSLAQRVRRICGRVMGSLPLAMRPDSSAFFAAGAFAHVAIEREAP